jgi:hypothetical protein
VQNPYSNLTCISSWYICIPNIIWINLTIDEKMNKNSFSKSFLSPRAITPSIMIGSHPYSKLTCISSWYICIPNIIWIYITINEKMNGNCHHHECDGRTDEEPDGHRHTIIRPFFNWCIKIKTCLYYSLSQFSYEKCQRKRNGVRCENWHAIQYFVWPPWTATTAI